MTPGLHLDVPMADYLADPALSSSGARLLTEVSPYEFKAWHDQPEPPKEHFDLGEAVHSLRLGVGAPLTRLPLDGNRSRKPVKEADAAARQAGEIPLKPETYDLAHAMAHALGQHRIAAALLDPDRGRSEVTAAAIDQATGVHMRCRYDYLPDLDTRDRLLLAEVKTTDRGLDDDAIGKRLAEYRYPQGGEWYVRVAQTLGLAAEVAYLWVWVSRRPPHAVRVTGLVRHNHELAKQLNDRALRIYADCTRTGTWSGYEAVDYIPQASWRDRRDEELLAA